MGEWRLEQWNGRIMEEWVNSKKRKNDRFPNIPIFQLCLIEDPEFSEALKAFQESKLF
jgi:hypothetical protein